MFVFLVLFLILRRLERENAELRQRLRDVGSLLGKTKLAEYMEKNNVSDAKLDCAESKLLFRSRSLC